MIGIQGLMIKYVCLFIIAAINLGCQQLTRGQLQPVVIKNGSYLTNCGGAAEGWGSCYSKASITCPSGYEVLLKEEGNTGILRELSFKCKN